MHMIQSKIKSADKTPNLPTPDTKCRAIRRKPGVVAGFAMGLALALLVALPATAQDFKKGRDAAKRGDYATAFKQWQPLAVQGHARAQHQLGIMYHNGRGVPLDEGEAVKWWLKAAKRGHSNAKYLLGVMYTRGGGVPRNEAEAAKWFRNAADRGHARAQFELGKMYAKGWGVPRNPVLAHMWFSLSAAKSNKHHSATRRDRAARRMTPTQIVEAEKLRYAWTENYNKVKVARALQRKKKNPRIFTKAPPSGPLPVDSRGNVSSLK